MQNAQTKVNNRSRQTLHVTIFFPAAWLVIMTPYAL